MCNPTDSPSAACDSNSLEFESEHESTEHEERTCPIHEEPKLPQQKQDEEEEDVFGEPLVVRGILRPPRHKPSAVPSTGKLGWWMIPTAPSQELRSLWKLALLTLIPVAGYLLSRYYPSSILPHFTFLVFVYGLVDFVEQDSPALQRAAVLDAPPFLRQPQQPQLEEDPSALLHRRTRRVRFEAGTKFYRLPKPMTRRQKAAFIRQRFQHPHLASAPQFRLRKLQGGGTIDPPQPDRPSGADQKPAEEPTDQTPIYRPSVASEEPSSSSSPTSSSSSPVREEEESPPRNVNSLLQSAIHLSRHVDQVCISEPSPLPDENAAPPHHHHNLGTTTSIRSSPEVSKLRLLASISPLVKGGSTGIGGSKITTGPDAWGWENKSPHPQSSTTGSKDLIGGGASAIARLRSATRKVSPKSGVGANTTHNKATGSVLVPLQDSNRF